MRIGVVAGEASGDLLGAGMIRAVKARHPDAEFAGVAGPLMQKAGCEVWEDAEVLAVMGLVEPLKVLPRLLRLRRDLIRRWEASKPDVFVGIDAPEFNLGLEKRLRKRGIRTIQYVSPQVWAWRKKRVKKIAKLVERMAVILPFEEKIYSREGLDCEFVGHPVYDEIQEMKIDSEEVKKELGLSDEMPVLSLLPGSRPHEHSRICRFTA